MKIITKINWVLDAHHIHVWSLSTTNNALTAHIVLNEWVNETLIKNNIKHDLLHQNIHHTTLETEYMKSCDESCDCNTIK